jgi:hypothetical protein
VARIPNIWIELLLFCLQPSNHRAFVLPTIQQRFASVLGTKDHAVALAFAVRSRQQDDLSATPTKKDVSCWNQASSQQ